MSKDAEHIEQSLLFQWADLAKRKYPELELLFAIPNFAGRLGKATARHGARLKREGRKRGVPDICLPVARGPYHALYIELKADKGKLRPEQKNWLLDLTVQKNCAVAAFGWEAARRHIEEYLALGGTP
jgi:hypothetical protein